MGTIALAVVVISINTINHYSQQVDGTEHSFSVLTVSWYGNECEGRTMANGKRFRAEDSTTAAHKEWPLGTKLLISNPDNDLQLVVEIKDRGPYVIGRDLDISEAAAKKLGVKERGVGTLLAKKIR